MYTRGEKTKTCTRIVRLFVRCIFKTISTKLLIFIFKYISLGAAVFAVVTVAVAVVVVVVVAGVILKH